MFWRFLQDRRNRFLHAISSIVCLRSSLSMSREEKWLSPQASQKLNATYVLPQSVAKKYCCTVRRWITVYAVHLLTWHKYKSLKNQMMNTKHSELYSTFMIQCLVFTWTNAPHGSCSDLIAAVWATIMHWCWFPFLSGTAEFKNFQYDYE